MGEAQGALEGQRSQQALPPEQEALERLRECPKRYATGYAEYGATWSDDGDVDPMLRQAGRFPMPEFMPQPNVDEQQAGAAGASVRNFQLPDKEAYKVPRMFREDIMEALKQGYPERFKELIEQYYRNIVR